MLLNEQLSQRLAGSQSYAPPVEFFSTHPNTEGRMQTVHNWAERHGVAEGEIPRIVDDYVNRLDGMLYGDDSDQGFVRGRSFVHPELRFAYEVPTDYTIQNGTNAVVAFHQDGSTINFDMGDVTGDRKRGMGSYLAGQMSQELSAQISNIQEFSVNGVRAASGRTTVTQNRRTKDVFVVAYEGDNDQVFRFVMMGPQDRRSFSERGWIDTMDSFRRLSVDEANGEQPLSIDVVRVTRGQSVSDLAARMAFDDLRVERFRTLNGLTNNETLREGQLVKIVVD